MPRSIDVTVPPTPSADVIRVNGVSDGSPPLQITIPALNLLSENVTNPVQVFLVLADATGTYSYLAFPANQAGVLTAQLDLSAWPIEIALSPTTDELALWLLAVENTHYAITERYGIEALAASLAIGFHSWLTNGNPVDDPLAAIVSNSDGALYEWFATINVLGQTVLTLTAHENWHAGLSSAQSLDGGMHIVYSVQPPIPSDAGDTLPENATETVPPLRLVADESFTDGTSTFSWFEGQGETYTNQVVAGAYEIQLTRIIQRDFGLSWGSIENGQFANYRLEAEVSLVEDDAEEARYGLWFNYQDDFNFVYFGISNTGEYRVAVIEDNRNRTEVQNWQPHPAIHPGAATNTLTIEAAVDGHISLAVNDEELLTFSETTFTQGSIAFFCYSKSVPTTCRLERLRLWELS